MLKAYFQKGVIEAGCDEAGRGCLAGPVVAGAVILPPDFKNKMLNDSKKLTQKKRDLLRVIIEKEALSFGVGIVDHKEIDEINQQLRTATFKLDSFLWELAKMPPNFQHSIN